MFRSRNFSNARNHIIDRFVAFIDDLKNHLAVFIGINDMVAVIVNEAYPPDLKIAKGRERFRRGICPCQSLRIHAVRLFFTPWCGKRVANGRPRKCSHNATDSRPTIASVPPVTTVAYKPSYCSSYAVA